MGIVIGIGRRGEKTGESSNNQSVLHICLKLSMNKLNKRLETNEYLHSGEKTENKQMLFCCKEAICLFWPLGSSDLK